MRPKVLQVAYVCHPEGHGEAWLGWLWAELASRFCDLHLLTVPHQRAAVIARAATHGITPHFVEIPETVLRWSQRFDAAGRWVRQFVWQHRIAEVAARLHAQERFDLVHQTTYHTFRVPFAASVLDIPAVWGPIAGGEQVPPGFGPYLGTARWSEAMRPWLNRLWLAAPWVQRALRRSRRLLVANRTTLHYLPGWCREKARLVPSNAFRGDLPELMHRPAVVGGSLRLLYVGNCIGRRGLPLVLHALQIAREVPCELTVAGTGDALAEWRREASRLGLADRVTFRGHVSRVELAPLYASAHALVFPGLRDSGGSPLVEAMSLGLPVICLDWGGPAEMVDAESGFKVPVDSPEQTIHALAEIFRRLHAEPEIAHRVGLAGAERCRRLFSVEARQRLLEEVYRELLPTKPSP